jgi:hypothetical protein
MSSYEGMTGGDVTRAIELYEWNSAVAGALFEVVGIAEVVFRNALHEQMAALASAKGWSGPWFSRAALFDNRANADIQAARERATRSGKDPELAGKVVAELSFGFWRFLIAKRYYTSLWVPALHKAFPHHPDFPNPRRLRSVEDTIQRIHFLRNRIAHHEPIHCRNLAQDHRDILNLVRWICLDTHAWTTALSRFTAVVARRPFVQSVPQWAASDCA